MLRTVLLVNWPDPAGHVIVSTVGYAPGARERYTLTRLHARGGIGQVWLARDQAFGREVALKELRPERAASPAVWARFLEEARITGQLEHPNIVPVHELAEPAGGRRPFYRRPARAVARRFVLTIRAAQQPRAWLRRDDQGTAFLADGAGAMRQRRHMFGDHLDPAVPEVARRADQTEFECPGTYPPPETHALHAPAHPCGQPNRILHVPGS